MSIRNILTMALLLVVAKGTLAQTDCGDEAILSMKGHWKKDPDIYRGNDKNLPRISRCLDSIQHLVAEGCGELKGVDATWYRVLNEPMVTGGPSAYSFNSLCKSWYCNQHVHKLLLADETGTWVEVHINWLGELITQQYNDMGLQIDGRPIFGLPLKQGKWKGYDLYQAGNRTTAHCLLITRNGMQPWKPVTQREYLQAWRAFLQKQRGASVPNTAAMQAADQKEIERIRNNPNMKPEMKEAGIRGVQEREALYAKSDQGAGFTRAYDEKIRLVDDYLVHTSGTVLDQPAWVDQKARSGFEGRFSSEAQGGRLMVTLDAGNYFSGQGSGAIPQLIVLHWRWDNNVPALHFKAQFEENFPIEKLAAMVSGSNK